MSGTPAKSEAPRSDLYEAGRHRDPGSTVSGSVTIPCFVRGLRSRLACMRALPRGVGALRYLAMLQRVATVLLRAVSHTPMC